MKASKLIETLQEAVAKAGDHDCAKMDSQDRTTAALIDGIIYDDEAQAFIICDDAEFAAMHEVEE